MKSVKTFDVRPYQEQHHAKRWKLKFAPTIKPKGSRNRWYAYTQNDKRILVVARDKLAKPRRIRGITKSPDELLMATIIHEIVHAVDPTIPEQTVLNIDSAAARLLTRLGFKR